MNAFPVDIVIKASALLAAAALVDAAFGRRVSAAARHLVWSVGIAGLLVLPVASYALPHWQITIRVPVTSQSNAANGRAAIAPRSPLGDGNASATTSAGPKDSPYLLAGPRLQPELRDPAYTAPVIVYLVYIAGVVLLLVRLGREPFVLRRLTRASRATTDPAWRQLLEDAKREVRVTRPVRLMQSDRELMPMTFGTRTATVMLPASADGWSDDRRRAVLLHELAHVARHDCVVQRLAALACALYWPHPGVWWAARRLRIERELACDDRVLASGAGAREYAGHLLDLAHSLGTAPAPATALAMARPRHLENRLLAVLDAARSHATLRRGALASAIVTSMAVILPLAAVRAAVVAVDREEEPSETAVHESPAPQSRDRTASPQDFIGTWEVRPGRDADSVNVTLRTVHGSHGNTVPRARLAELGVPPIPAEGPIHFVGRRDAGSFTFDGVCRNSVCGGTFAFEPNAGFAAELAKRGIGAPTLQEQYRLALADVGFAWLDELAANGYQKPTVRDMVRAADHGVGLDYVRGMASLGYRVGTLDALILLRDHGVDPDFVRGMASNGFARLSADDLVRARDHGVDPTYVKGMRDLGYGSMDLAGLIAARDHGVDPEYIRGMQAFGYRLALDDLRRTRDHGVDPEYVRGLADLGYKGLAIDALVRARDHGVDPEYVRGLAELGYKALSIDDLIRLRDHGVDPPYVRRLQQRGLAHPSVDELIQRRDRGDGDPDAAAQAVAASAKSLWQSIVTWLRS